MEKKSDKIIIMRNIDLSTRERNSFNQEYIYGKNQRNTNENNIYFSNLRINESNRRTYCNNSININEINNNFNERKNWQISRRNNFYFPPHLKTERNKIYNSSKFQEESKNESKIAKKKFKNKINYLNIKNNNSTKNNKALNLENFINSQIIANNNKTLNLDIMPTYSIRLSDSINKKNKDFSNKYPIKNYIIRNSFSIEYKNGKFCEQIISPLNGNNKEKIIINETTNNKKDNNDDMRGKNKYINKNNKNDENNEKIDIIEIDNNFFEKKSTSILKRRIRKKKNYSIIENRIIKNISYSKENDISKDNFKNNCTDNNIKSNTNSRINEIKPITMLNYNSDKQFLINTPSPNKKELNFTFLNKSRLNKKKYERINKSNYMRKGNLSFNNGMIIQNKNFSLISDKQKNEIDINNSTGKSEKIRLINNSFNINESKSEINSEAYNNNYRGKISNNESLGETYFKNRNTIITNNYKCKDKNQKSEESYMDINNSLDNNKRIKINKRNKNYNNNYIKIITDRKKDINSKQIKKISNISVKNNLINSNIFNDNINDYKRRNYYYYLKKEKDFLHEKEKKENLKVKKERFRLNTNNTYNYKKREKAHYSSKINNSNNVYNSNDINNSYYFKYNLNEKRNELYNNDRNENEINNDTYTYIKNMNDRLSNKNLNDRKKKIYCRYNISNTEKNNSENYDINNCCEYENNKQNKTNRITSYNAITNNNKRNIYYLPSITIDMNVLNQNNKKYLRLYDAIKNKL